MIRRVLQWNPRATLAYGAILIAVIAAADWRIEINATLGFLYIFPMVLLGILLNWWQLVFAAAFCTLLSDRLDPFPMDMESARDFLIFLTLTITGLLSWNVAKSYRKEMESLAGRRAAEEQLAFLIESSPAAVLTMTGEGEILLANPAAHRLLGVAGGSLPGRRIARYVPALG
jgi:two-component system sensor kinase FixL